MRQTIIGFFNNASDAERAAEKLRSSGFPETDIDLSTGHTQSNTTDSSLGSDSSSQYTSGHYSSGAVNPQDTTTPYGVSDESRYSKDTTGSTSSRDLNEGRIKEHKDDNDESFGDSIGRFFRNLFDNDEEAERYASVGRRNSIVSVFTDSSDEAERAREILDDCGAVDVDEQSSQDTTAYGSYNQGSANQGTSIGDTDRNEFNTERNDLDLERRKLDTERTADYETRNSLSADGVTDQSLPIIEENINVGKREVERGGVRLRSRIIEKPIEENLRLREEHVRVDRVAVDRPATDSDFDTFREGEVEMTETSEVPNVKKEARVVEEVRLSKEVQEREETVRDTVRKTDVEVEKLNEETMKSRKRKDKL